tara:strand:+ start:323 stop:1909 length:1587 start_codon:yes stop_codon:yes gene_type:complete
VDHSIISSVFFQKNALKSIMSNSLPRFLLSLLKRKLSLFDVTHTTPKSHARARAKNQIEKMNAEEAISWLSALTNAPIASLGELRLQNGMLLKVALEIVLPTGGENLNSFSRSDGSALRSALDELSIGGHRADEAMHDGDEDVLLEIINALKAKYDLRKEIEALKLIQLEDDEKILGENEVDDDVDDVDDDVFGMRDGDALDELDDLGFYVAPNAKPSSSPNASSPVKFINASSLLDGEKSFELSPPFKSSNNNNEDENKEDGDKSFDGKSIQRIPSFTRWNRRTEEENDEENEENILSSFAKGRNESLAWFSPLNPDKPALSQAESTLSVAEIALLRRGKALSSSLSSEEKKKKKKNDKVSSPYFTTKSAESKRAKSPLSQLSSSRSPTHYGKRTNASEIKIALKFGALAGESDQMKRLRNEALKALETENVPGAKRQFVVLFSEASENSKTYRGLYKVCESLEGCDDITLRKIHGVSEKVPDALSTCRILKSLKYNLATKMWRELHNEKDRVNANVMAVVLKPKKK